MATSPEAAGELVITVSRLTRYLRRRLERDAKLQNLRVSGEVTNLSGRNGTLYFSLKDNEAIVSCVAWSEVAGSLPPFANGDAVVVRGTVGVYDRKGVFQITVYDVELEGGAGRLHAMYEARKRRLAADGLFALQRKRKVPRYPFHIALVSSRTANGANDFLSQAALLAPHVRVELFETSVQGEGAAPEIVRALERASRAGVDVIVLARGGGSYEDLFVFSNETVVRALAKCVPPTVSAIGHEADAPLTDFVADLRVGTPTDAARTLLEARTTTLASIRRCSAALDAAMLRAIKRVRVELDRVEVRSPLADSAKLLRSRRQAVDGAALELQRALQASMRECGTKLAKLTVRLDAANPNVRLGQRRERLTAVTHALDRSMRETAGRKRNAFARVQPRLHPAIAGSIGAKARRRLPPLASRLDAASPAARVAAYREKLSLARYALARGTRDTLALRARTLTGVSARFAAAVAVPLNNRSRQLALLDARLLTASPEAILKRGYAIVTLDGRSVTDAATLAPGTPITARLARGSVTAHVESQSLDG